MQTIERLELPTETYHALEQIALLDGISLPIAVKQLVKERLSKRLRSLRREYQRLVDKELMGTVSLEEAARVEVLCHQINTLQMQSKAVANQHRRLDEIDTRLDEIGAEFQELRKAIETLPDRVDKDTQNAVHS